MTSAPSLGARPLRIAYITKEPLPSTDAATVQIVQTASALARAGAELDLFVPVPALGGRRSAEALRAELRAQYHTSCDFGLRPLATGLRPLETVSVGLHWIAAGLAAARDHYDLVHTRDVQNVLFGLAAGCRVSYESYRTPDSPPALVRGVLRRAFAAPRFLGQITHSRFARERYVARGYPAEKIRTIYNGFDPEAFAIERSPAEARRLLGLPERVTVAYAGRIAELKRIDLLLDAAAATPELSWLLAGDSESAEAAPFVARAATLPNVTLLGYRAGTALAPALQAADILVIPPSAEPLQRFGSTVLPLKVFQYLAAGRPLVVGDVADTAELLQQDATCLRVPPDELPPFVAAIRSLAEDPARRARLGSAARALAQGLSWDARASRMLEYFRERLAASESR
ncbi:MAG TPA: glycosyltransferase family 4 protein [Gemmatimonadales bacterium]|jgi:glycosyltransferase involved in cell wall biosynthesis|nr:glycosyltransferase family 4 protein [Gemmatimonadales bacterium]